MDPLNIALGVAALICVLVWIERTSAKARKVTRELAIADAKIAAAHEAKIVAAAVVAAATRDHDARVSRLAAQTAKLAADQEETDRKARIAFDILHSAPAPGVSTVTPPKRRKKPAARKRR